MECKHDNAVHLHWRQSAQAFFCRTCGKRVGMAALLRCLKALTRRVRDLEQAMPMEEPDFVDPRDEESPGVRGSD